MLVLSRKIGERVQIGDTITITVIGVEMGRVRLGIEAPRDLAIYRQTIPSRTPQGDAPATPATEGDS